jgi:hypothetical protein
LFPFQTQRPAQFGHAVDGNLAAKERAAIRRRDTADPYEIGRELVPDWQQEPCREIEALALVARPRFIDLGDPGLAESVDGDPWLPAAFSELILGDVAALQRAQQLEAGHARAVIGKNAAGRHEQGNPA